MMQLLRNLHLLPSCVVHPVCDKKKPVVATGYSQAAVYHGYRNFLIHCCFWHHSQSNSSSSTEQQRIAGVLLSGGLELKPSFVIQQLHITASLLSVHAQFK